MKKKSFKIIIAGSRGFDNYSYLKRRMNLLLHEKTKTHEIIIVSGGAKGADSLGEKYARLKGYEVERFIPDWGKYGKPAGPIRNSEMAKYADAAVVFWDGKSTGSNDMINKMRNLEKPLKVYLFEDWV